MDSQVFCREFERIFKGHIYHDTRDYNTDKPQFSTFWKEVQGMTSPKVAKLLNLLYSLLPDGEGYLEVGTHQGKTLISALLGNKARPTFACDNFSEYSATGNAANDEAVVKKNLAKFGLERRVSFHNCDYKNIMNKETIPAPIGVFFFDGAHDILSQYLAVTRAEAVMADEAILVVDDWEMEAAYEGTVKGIQDSSNDWQIIYELPSHGVNGPRRDSTWWNGLGVMSFKRQPKQAKLPLVV